MPIRSSLIVAASVALAAMLPLIAFAASPAEPKTAAAVLAADKAWGAAEARGDAAFVDWLLLPDYRSVGPTGKATSKARIVAGARARSPMTEAKIAAWKVDHPLRGDVAIFGDTAVLTWVSTKPSSDEPISSCDIFAYRNGHWHAVYSQHSDVSA